jgi:hypothetical protein
MSAIIFSSLAKLGFTYFAYNAYDYYRLNKLKIEVETSGQVDLSYEILNKDKLLSHANKSFLIAGTNRNKVDINIQSEIFNGKRLEIIKKSKDNIELLSEVNKDVNIKVLTENKYIPYYDCGNLRAEEVIKIHQISKLSLIEKVNYFKNLVVTKQQKEKRIFIIEKGLSENQRVLVFGKLSFNSNSVLIKPKLVICSGLVEFEEMIEYLRESRSKRMFQISIILGLLASIDLFSRVLKQINNNNKI